MNRPTLLLRAVPSPGLHVAAGAGPFRLVRLGAVLGLCALAAACGGAGGDSSNGDASAPPQTGRSLGLMEITISGLGTRAISSHARMVTAAQVAHSTAEPATVPLGLDVQQASASTVDAGGERYFTVVYNVRNAQFCNTPGSCTAYTSATHNLTLIGANTAGNINNTALTGIKLFDGSSSTATQALATSLLPTHGMQFNAGAGSGVMVTPGLASLQVYSESEVSSASIPRDTGATDLFPFGYVVRNVNTPGSRSLPANPAANQWDGEVAFSFKIPLQSDSTQDPYSISMIFQVIDDTNTRVTQSVEEQAYAGDLAAALRATTLNGADVAVLGGRVAQVNDGDPICTVRIAGTAASTSATLVDNGATNSGATLASAPLNPAQGDALQFGFCTPMAVPAATALAISGSLSGTHAGTYTANGNVVSFAPNSPFLPGETVNYTATTTMQSSGGTALSAPWTGSFSPGTVTRPASSGTFALQSPAATASAPTNVAVADFDGDGKPDIAVLNAGTHVVTIYPGSGAATFTVGLGSAALGLVAGDFNGDGKPDLVAVGGKNLYLALNQGGKSFTNTTVGGGFTTTADLVVGDFNHDGFADVAMVGTVSPNIEMAIFRGGSGGLTKVGTINSLGSNTLATGRVAAVADFNGDGLPDVAVLCENKSAYEVLIRLGNGDGTFKSGATGSVHNASQAIVAADFNGDGLPDLAVSNNFGAVDILLNSASGFTAAPITTPAAGNHLQAIAAGDFDGNGTVDLAVADTQNHWVTILLNDGTGNFSVGTKINLSGSTAAPTDMAALDFNGDGRLDLVVPSSTSSNLDVLLGQP